MSSESQHGACRASGVLADLSALAPGMISLYQSDAALAQVADVFVGAGLAAGERVLYVAGDRILPTALASLKANPAAGPAVTAGQLVVRSSSDLDDGTDRLDLTAARQQVPGNRGPGPLGGLPGVASCGRDGRSAETPFVRIEVM